MSSCSQYQWYRSRFSSKKLLHVIARVTFSSSGEYYDHSRKDYSFRNDPTDIQLCICNLYLHVVRVQHDIPGQMYPSVALSLVCSPFDAYNPALSVKGRLMTLPHSFQRLKVFVPLNHIDMLLRATYNSFVQERRCLQQRELGVCLLPN